MFYGTRKPATYETLVCARPEAKEPLPIPRYFLSFGADAPRPGAEGPFDTICWHFLSISLICSVILWNLFARRGFFRVDLRSRRGSE